MSYDTTTLCEHSLGELLAPRDRKFALLGITLAQDEAAGLIGLAEALPFIATALFAGHVADTRDRRWIALLAMTALLGCAGALLARVIANRVWQAYFGRGIVETDNDFGSQGTPPSHPELLDWLACEFRDGGGSLKDLHRLVVSSATWRQRADDDPRAAAVDSGAVDHARNLPTPGISAGLSSTSFTDPPSASRQPLTGRPTRSAR